MECAGGIVENSVDGTFAKLETADVDALHRFNGFNERVGFSESVPTGGAARAAIQPWQSPCGSSEMVAGFCTTRPRGEGVNRSCKYRHSCAIT